MSDYGSMFEGRQIWDPVKHLNVNHSDVNEFQDQLIEDYKSRVVQGHLDGRCTAGAFQGWYYSGSAMQCATNSLVWRVGFRLQLGEIINEVGVAVSGNGCTAGSIDFICYQENAGASGVSFTSTIDGAAAHPWDTGGIAYANRATYTITSTDPNLPATAGLDKYYVINFAAPTNAAANNAYIWQSYIKVQRA